MANLFWHDAHLNLVARQGKGSLSCIVSVGDEIVIGAMNN